MVFTIIGIFLLLYSLKYYKKGFLYYMLFEVLYFPNAKIVDISGVPSIPLSLLMSLGFALIYYIKYGKRINRKKFPLTLPFCFITFSRFISCFTAIAGFEDEFPRFIGFLFSSIVEVWIMWQVIETKYDFDFVIKGFVILFFFVGLYSIGEFFMQFNFIFEYKSSLIPDGINVYNAGDIRGYRVTSFFEHPIGTGMNCGLYVITVLLSLIIYHNTYCKKLVYLSVMFCIMCIIFTKMRAGILFTIIGAISFLNFRDFQIYKLLGILLLVLFLTFPLYSDNLNIFLSLFSRNAQDSVGGSNIEMRIEQLEACSYYFEQSPISGFGEQFLVNMKDSGYLFQVRGLESVYFEESVKHGILGLLATLILMYYSLIKLPKRYHSKELFFVSLAYWLTYSMTSIPFFRMNMYYFALFYILKQSTYYRKDVV